MHSSLLTATLFGLIEGLTELFPVSSTGHMIIASHLFKLDGEIIKIFEIMIQLGYILTIFVTFWKRIVKLVDIQFNYSFFVQYILRKKTNKRCLTIFHIILGIMPTLMIGSIFHCVIKSLFNLISIIYALIAGGVLLIIAEYFKPKKLSVVKLDDITYQKVLIISIFQCLALWPGFSRSCAAISGSMLIGISRCVALEFSFLLAIPLIIGATVLDLYTNISIVKQSDIPMFGIGVLIAFIVSLISIKIFLPLIKRISFIPFAIYRFVMATLIYILSSNSLFTS